MRRLSKNTRRVTYTYADVCGRILTYADVCGRMLTAMAALDAAAEQEYEARNLSYSTAIEATLQLIETYSKPTLKLP